MPTIQEMEDFIPDVKPSRYSGPTTYCGVDVPPESHPASLANYILNIIQHTHMVGMQIIGPMGYGKNRFASCIAYNIIKKDPKYTVVWAEAEEFGRLKSYLKTLPKSPLILIFDDLTSKLRSMPQKEQDANFNELTKIRHTLDPNGGKIDVIVFTISHYSLNMSKEYRNVLGITAFLGFGLEERSNLDRIAPKDSPERWVLEKYARIAGTMFSQHSFYILLKNGARLDFKTDDPCRAAAVVTQTDARIILFAEKDTNELCIKKKNQKTVSARDFLDNIKHMHGLQGRQALKIILAKRGHVRVLPPRVAAVCDAIEQRYFEKFDVDEEELVDQIWKDEKRLVPKNVYHKRKLENEVMEELEKIATVKTGIDLTERPEFPPENNDIPLFQNEAKYEETENTSNS